MRLSDVLKSLGSEEFVVPEFQREFEWDAEGIRQLIYSVFSEYDIGSLLLWPTDEKRSREQHCENLFGFRDRAPQSQSGKRWIVLDGQQRLSALHYAFFGSQALVHVPDSSDRQAVRFVIDLAQFMDESASEHQRRAAIRWESRPNESITAPPKNKDDALEYPLEAVGERQETGSDRYLDDLVRKLEDNAAVAHDKHEQLEDLVGKLEEENDAVAQDKLEQLKRLKEEALQYYVECDDKLRLGQEFQKLLARLLFAFSLSTVVISEDAPVDRVVDLFVQINRQGKPLSPFGRLNAAASLHGLPVTRDLRRLDQSSLGMQRTHVETALLRMMMIRAHPESRYDTGEDADRLLPGGFSRRSGGRPLVENADELGELWEKAVEHLAAGVAEMRGATGGYGVVDTSVNLPGGYVPGFPYVAMIPVFCTLHADAQRDPAKEQKIRQWYWASVLTDRYNSENPTPLGRTDLAEIRSWFENDQATPEAVRRVREDFGLAELAGVRDEQSASRSERVRHHMLLNLMYAFQPHDWQNNLAVRLDSIEAKFLIPRDWCEDNGVLKRSTFSPFNRVLLERDTAERLGSRLPSEYLPELLQTWPDRTKARLLESHFISEDAEAILMRDPLTPDDLDDFLHERTVTFLRQVGGDLFQTDLAVLPDMRELARRIEKLELTLRDIVAMRYGQQGRDLPHQVRQELNWRRQGRELSNTTDLRSHLDFAGLYELEESVLVLWNEFADLFSDDWSKSAWDEFRTNMHDLRDLRNSIAHARSVDPLTQRKGEAAILWLEHRCSRF